MSLQIRLANLITSIGADIKELQDSVNSSTLIPIVADAGAPDGSVDTVYDGGSP